MITIDDIPVTETQDEVTLVPVITEADGILTIESEDGEKVFEGEHIGFVQVGEDA